MKKLFHFGLLLLCWSCNVEDVPQHPIEGLYYGRYISQVITNYSDITYTSNDTQFIKLYIDADRYEKPGYAETNCKGSTQIFTDTISFSPKNCACACDCSPYVDCEGDYLFGNFAYKLQNDSLFLLSDRLVVYEPDSNGITLESTRYYKFLELERN